MVVGDGRDVSLRRVVQHFGASGQVKLCVATAVDRSGIGFQVVVMEAMMMEVHVFLFDQSHDVAAAASLFRFSFSRLDAVFSHGQWAVDAMQFKVQPTSIANWFSFVVATPQCCRSCAAVGAA